MNTIFLKPGQIQRKWYVIDAEGVTLGKLAVKVATLLRGKHRPYYAPHQEMGDYVIVVNAEKVTVSGRKRTDKIYYHHTGYPGALRSRTFEEAIDKKPTFPVEHAIKGMLPKNRLGRKLFGNVKVYAGSDHPHVAQQPEKLEIS